MADAPTSATTQSPAYDLGPFDADCRGKIHEAIIALEAHYRKVPLSSGTASGVNHFLKFLANAGGTSADALSGCTFEDLESFGAPKLVARKIATIFRGPEKQQSATAPDNPIIQALSGLHTKPVGRMTVAELIPLYDPDDATNEVGTRLNTIAKGRRCVVFDSNGKVDVFLTTRVIDDLRGGGVEREVYMTVGGPTKVWKIGDRPNRVLNENPFFPGTPLDSDQTCLQTHVSWVIVGHATRQLIYLAVTRTKELGNSPNEIHNVMDLLSNSDGAARLVKRLPKATVLLAELEATGKSPSLKISPNAPGGGQKANDPFGTPKTF